MADQFIRDLGAAAAMAADHKLVVDQGGDAKRQDLGPMLGLIRLSGASGTNTITAAGNPSLTAGSGYVTGLYLLKTAGANSGAVTLNVDSRGAKAVKSPSGAALAGGELASGIYYLLVYDGTDFIILAPF